MAESPDMVAAAERAKLDPLLDAIRRHIRSFEPGTLIGSELNVALHLRDLDGEIWEPWCVPGTKECEQPNPDTEREDQRLSFYILSGALVGAGLGMALVLIVILQQYGWFHP